MRNESAGARCLEDLGVRRRLARLRAAEAAGAAVPRRVENGASALTRHHYAVVVGADLEAHKAHHVQVADAAGVAALSGALKGGDGDGEVVAVDEAYIVEVLVVSEGDFG
ncbi:hypothetical protein C1H46_013813 [Malus baccata]|uniref:Uncharacterized protein n=1 Tax=Malus baccata TaxID=106549 RepID=A0A540MP67_MALBA|nr:hypothetical protein C1H46_013813 [Malus baccata]